MEITVAPLVRDICCEEVILFDVTERGVGTISSEVVAIENIYLSRLTIEANLEIRNSKE